MYNERAVRVNMNEYTSARPANSFCTIIHTRALSNKHSFGNPDDAPHDVTFCFGKTSKRNKLRHFSPFRLTSKWAVYI